MDTKTIIHIGCEIVVIGGVIYWTKKNITEVNGRCDDLFEYSNKLEKILVSQAEKIARLEMVVSRLINADINNVHIPSPSPPPQNCQPVPSTFAPQSSPPQTSSTPPQQSIPDEQLKSMMTPLAHRKKKTPPPPPPQLNDYESDYLDEMLRKENAAENEDEDNSLEVEVFEEK